MEATSTHHAVVESVLSLLSPSGAKVEVVGTGAGGYTITVNGEALSNAHWHEGQLLDCTVTAYRMAGLEDPTATTST